jgi:hypothetical protein
MVHTGIRHLYLLILILSTVSCTVSKNYRSALTSFEIGEYNKSIASFRKVYTKTKDRQQKAVIQFKIAEVQLHGCTMLKFSGLTVNTMKLLKIIRPSLIQYPVIRWLSMESNHAKKRRNG